MKAANRERGQILILLASWLFFGGGAASALVVYDRPGSEQKKAIERVIADAGRKEGILSDVSQWEAGQKKQDKEVSANREELLTTLRRKDARRSELEPLLAKLDTTLARMDREFLDVRFRVKERVTSTEWAEIAPRPDR